LIEKSAVNIAKVIALFQTASFASSNQGDIDHVRIIVTL